MPCFYPLPATRIPGGGKPLVHSRLNPPANYDIKLPCGRCIGCRTDRQRGWATRCLHESQLHKDNAFITLTIGNPSTWPSATRNLEPPSTESLSKTSHQKFLKRLRKDVGQFRYYMCGEYGEKLGRPHYHYLLFGYNFPDRKYSHTSGSGEKLYTSAILSNHWPFGKAWIGDVTYESCAYVAAYVMKKMTGEKAVEHYRRTDEAGNDYWLEPEYNEMSRRPGIGKHWWMKFNQDITTGDYVVRPNGGKMRPPRYYDKLLELYEPGLHGLTKLRRELRAQELAEDNTPARLMAKEAVMQAKLDRNIRQLEKP